MQNFSISNPREYRLLAQLLKKPTFRRDLNGIIGAINTPQNVFDMRKRGLILPCERVAMPDRDGKRSNPGRYSLHPAEVETVQRAIKEWEQSAATLAPKLDSNNPNSDVTAK